MDKGEYEAFKGCFSPIVRRSTKIFRVLRQPFAGKDEGERMPQPFDFQYVTICHPLALIGLQLWRAPYHYIKKAPKKRRRGLQHSRIALGGAYPHYMEREEAVTPRGTLKALLFLLRGDEPNM